ncbi:MAG: DNA polymerase I [Anaerolineae bacterium]|nr:DNA polymerase I [Anaerolineae bacterium]MDW8098121.1 DNA polymerase I [Anaerolineae bacterium]
MPKLVLLDGHSLAFRAFYALPPEMATSSGELTNAVYGFTSMILNILQEEKPDYIAIAFDTGPTFRHELAAEYKGTRARMPEELRGQLLRIRQIVEALNIPTFEIEGYEADDLIGTLARQAEAQGVQTVICSGDRDLFQLVNDHIVVRYTPGGPRPKTFTYDLAAVQERYQLYPQQLADLKALIGDKSDNIPGVPGIGEKTAAQLLQQYGSLEGIYAHLEEINSPRVREVLAEYRDQAFRSRRLATLVTDLPVQLDLERCRTSDFDRERVLALFRELEFRSLVNRLPESSQPRLLPSVPSPESQQLPLFTATAPAENMAPVARMEAQDASPQVITTLEALQAIVETLREAPWIAFDTETTDMDAMRARLVGLAVAWDRGQAAYIPVGHQSSLAGLPQQLSWETVRAALAPIFVQKQQRLIAHNANYDLVVLRRHGLPVAGVGWDTMIAEWLLDPSGRNLGLKGLAFSRLGVAMTEITDLIGKGRRQLTMDAVPIEQVAPYAAADAEVTLRLMNLQARDLEEKKLSRLFHEVEIPLISVLVDMEMAGVALDVNLLRQMSRELGERLATLQEQIYEWVGYRFNLNSTQQLSDALFGKLALPATGLRKTASGYYSTAADVLESLRGRHPVIDLILEHRTLEKLRSTYVDALPQLIHPETGRLHTDYNQTGTETGRISSSNPNLQNIPIRTEEGRRIRKAFVAEPGWRLLAADYSQVELRILAHVSQDPVMLDAFARGEDIHASTAAKVYGIPIHEVTPEQRRIAKAVNFGLMYGQSAYGLAQQTGMDQDKAAEFIAAYFKTYPKVKQYLDRTRQQAAEQGYVETLLGRRRYFPELQNRRTPHSVRMAAERAAINAPIQGTAADIIKIAMIRLHEALRARGMRSRMILQVHDELVLECPEEELSEVAALVREKMEGAFALAAPLKVELEAGPNWYDLEPI